MRSDFRLAVVHLAPDDPGEGFVRAHAERLPCRVSVIHGDKRRPFLLDGEPLQSRGRTAELVRLTRRAYVNSRGRNADSEEVTSIYVEAFRRARAQAVLAEFGHVGAQALDACRRLDLPLVVHFHGFDVHCKPILETAGARYPELFEYGAAFVVVSRHMQRALEQLGAPPEKVHYSPYGVDLKRFRVGLPGEAAPSFLAVGRFVDKKAPHLTITAFASVWRQHPDARLRMVGDGELMGACRDLTRALRVEPAVTFLGVQPNETVAREMQEARAFVQHSLVALDGDSEGMPNSILEASACGLPVISTRHAGIPEVVLEGETGFLVDEHDIDGMAAHMVRLIEDPDLARSLGLAGRSRIQKEFTLDASIARLWDLIQSSTRADR